MAYMCIRQSLFEIVILVHRYEQGKFVNFKPIQLKFGILHSK
jgi:hypothetical protein